MKCGKVKNPCKICFQSVSNKNGLQCKGACKKWAHFKCLNYTPGKISDIKAGLIKITCPCPNCSPSEPKEVLTNPPFTCSNQECPATKIPSCESTDCPSKQKPIPPFQPPIPTLTRPESPKLNQTQSQCTPPSQSSPKARICPSPPRKASPPRPVSPPKRPVSPPRRPVSPPIRPASPPSAPRSACPSCNTHCPKTQKRAADKLFPPQRSQSCSLNSASSHSGKCQFGLQRTISSDSALPNAQDQKAILKAIEEMFNTVGRLSTQLKDLMCKMMNTFENTKRRN